ncbi:MAG: peptidoglycan-binding protein [Ruminococcus sp.]|nr:peptidoglycan-binding protein [Ruminococcus sp.]
MGAYYATVQPVSITGYFGAQTETSVKSFQQVFGLPETGILDRATWVALYDAYVGILASVPLDTTGNDVVLYPGTVLQEGQTSDYVRLLQEYLTYIHQTYPEVGAVGAAVWNAIAGLYSDLRYGYDKQPFQNPGYIIS